MASKAAVAGVAAVIIILAALFVFAGRAGKYSVAVQMTDPPTVPAGTQALIISYSSVAVHTSGSNQSGWVQATGSGTVNLLAMTNVSQTIANTRVSANSTVNLVRFNITSASITRYGTTYNITVPNSQVSVAVVGSSKINSSSEVLIDFYPTVNAYGSTKGIIYTMAPAARAIVIGSNSTVSINTNVGGTASISGSVRARFGLGLGGSSAQGNSSNATYGTPVIVSVGSRVSNFAVQRINHTSGTVSGLLYIQYPVASSIGTSTTLHVNGTVGYACDNTEFRLTGIYSNGTASFTPLLNTKTAGGCPI